MSLSYIIDTIAQRLAYDVDAQRSLIVNKANRAVKEIYESQDLPDSLRECAFAVTPNNIIAIPQFVGELRAAREKCTHNKIPLKDLAPKYRYNSWPEEYRVWNIIGYSPITNSIQNAAMPINISIEEPDSVDISISIRGQTPVANNISITVTIATGETDTQVNTPFINIASITKSVLNNQDVSIIGYDTAGTNELTLAIIPNDKLESRYLMVDVSRYPYGDLIDGSRYIDVLFKLPLIPLIEDLDQFQLGDVYDDAIVCKIMEHTFSDQSDGGNKAIGFYQKCEQLVSQIITNKVGTLKYEMQFESNPYLGLYPRGIVSRYSNNRYPGWIR